MSNTNFHESVETVARKLCTTLEPGSVFSPLSIACALSMLHMGSSGTTERELSSLLEFKASGSHLAETTTLFNSDIIKLASALIINKDYHLNQAYLDATKSLAMITNEDFRNKSAIVAKTNSFIDKNTNGLIKDILKEHHISNDALMVLINTLYFKTKWDKPFQQCLTVGDMFNEKLFVAMMNRTDRYAYFEDSKVQIVELPYEDKKFCMGFILPKNFDTKSCHAYLSHQQPYSYSNVHVRIPKFTQRKNIDLIPHLKKLGLRDIFTQQSMLDKMFDGSNATAYVSVMIHEAVVIVDEEGTEAAAVTVAVTTRGCMRAAQKPIYFNANHSFVYYIKYYPTNTLLFVGDYHGF